jgi:hypothetical protein
VNTIRGLGENIQNSVIVQKMLRSLPMRFDPKISTLEKRQYPATLSMDELHGILTTYEMRTETEKSIQKVNNYQSLQEHKKEQAKVKTLLQQ